MEILGLVISFIVRKRSALGLLLIGSALASGWLPEYWKYYRAGSTARMRCPSEWDLFKWWIRIMMSYQERFILEQCLIETGSLYPLGMKEMRIGAVIDWERSGLLPE
jgi:hypothetical protein